VVSETAGQAGHSCEGCTECCHILPIAEPDVQKPANATCVNCIVGVGCGIYEARYHVCHRFMCGWVLDETIDLRWRPRDSHMVLTNDRETATLVAQVDSAYPNAWRQPPFIDDLRAWAASPTPERQRVVVKVGDDVTIIFPIGEKFIGPIGPGQTLMVYKIEARFWTVYDAKLVDRTDPSANGAIGRPAVAGPGALRLDLPESAGPRPPYA
jgi:hypothetical protein